MDEMVAKLIEEEKRLRAAEPMIEANGYLSPPIDVEALLATGKYITADDYRKYRETGILPDYYKG